jgi:hypothetical protein
MKKQRLNQTMYKLYLSLANTWGNSWPYIQEAIKAKLQRTAQAKYKTLDEKIQRLAHDQTITPREQYTFFPRVVNNTNIYFSENELALLNKGPKYNLHNRHKHWLTNLALEAKQLLTGSPYLTENTTGNKYQNV